MLVAVGVLVGEGQASWVVKISAVLKVNLSDTVLDSPNLLYHVWTRGGSSHRQASRLLRT